MTPILSYLLKANIVLIVLYGFYFLCFRRDTFYGHIRWYFLTTIASAIIFSLIDISSWLTGSTAAISVSQFIPSVDAVYQYVFVQPQLMQMSQMPQIEYDIVEPAITRVVPFGLILLWCWLLVAVFMLGKRLVQLSFIVRLWRCFSRKHHSDSAIIAIDRNIQPFSFFGRIFLNPDLYSKNEMDEIIAHEQIHCRQGHTIDNLMAEALVCLCWFNPVVWLLRRDLKQNLEYHTDRMTLRSGFDRKHYQYSLLRIAGNSFQIVNHFQFNHFNHLKKRIIMLNKKESPRIMTAKYLLAAPALAVALLSVQASGLQAAETDSVNVMDENHVWTDVTTTSGINSNDFLAEKIVQRNEATKTVATNLRDLNAYKEANQIELSTIEAFGVLDNKTAMDLYGIEDASNLFFIKSKTESHPVSPQEPVKLETIPDYRQRQGTTYAPDGDNIPKATLVSGDLQVDIYDTEIQLKNVIKIRGNGLMSNKPLVIVDGKEVDDNYKIDPNTIESISVLKDIASTAIYGEKAIHGVILINTKKGVILPAQALSKKGEFAFIETIQVSGTVTNAKDGQPIPGVAIVVKDRSIGTTTDKNGKYILSIPASVTLQFSHPDMVTQEIVVGNQRVINVVMSEDVDSVVMTGIKKSTGEAKIVSIKPRQSKTNAHPLYIIDGKDVDNLNIDPKSIESISILKDQSAIALYGEKAKNGVVLISLKK